MFMECIDCHHITDADMTIKPSGDYECPACGGPYMIYQVVPLPLLEVRSILRFDSCEGPGDIEKLYLRAAKEEQKSSAQAEE